MEDSGDGIDPHLFDTGPTDPLAYPGRPLRGRALLAGTCVHPLIGDRSRLRDATVVADGDHVCERMPPGATIAVALRELDATDLADRHVVLAVGSNASPGVMHHKLASAGVSTAVPYVFVDVRGIAAGHSAHVSTTGFIAAAPFATPQRASFAAPLLDDDQLAAVDATEPNYDRVPIDGAADLPGDLGPTVHAYTSHWGVLAHRGRPLQLRPQPTLHRTLRRIDARFAADTNGLGAREIIDRLAHDGRNRTWARHWSAAGLVVDDPLPGT